MVDLTNEEGGYDTQSISKEPFMCEYGVTIQEAPQTPEDKEETAEMISTIGDKVAAINPQGALKIYAVAMKSLNLDAEDKKQIIEAMTPQEIDPQEYEMLKQQVQLLSSETNKADVQNKLASAQKSLAGAELEKARIALVQADTHNKGASTVKTLEEAQRTDADTLKIQAETAVIRSGKEANASA